MLGEQKLHHRFNRLWIIGSKLHNDHDITRIRRTDHYIPKHSDVETNIVINNSAFLAELIQRVPDRVGRIRLQMAMINCKDLIETLGYVKTQRVFCKFFSRIELFLSEPSPVGKSEFQFITIIFS